MPAPEMTRHRAVAVGVILVVLLAVGLTWAFMARASSLQSKGYNRSATVNGVQVWTKVDGDQIDVVATDSSGKICSGNGYLSQPVDSICADATGSDKSAFVQVAAKPSPDLQVVTQQGTNVSPTLVKVDGGYLAVAFASDTSLLGAHLS